MTTDLRPLLRIDDVAAYLNVGRTSVYKLVKQDGLPALRLGVGLRVDADALRAWALSRVAGEPTKPVVSEAPAPIVDRVRPGPGARPWRAPAKTDGEGARKAPGARIKKDRPC